MTEPAKTTAADDARVMRIWRECGLPEYFLGNGGTNDKLVKFADAIDEDDDTNVRQVAREIRLQDEARIAELEAQLRQERKAKEEAAAEVAACLQFLNTELHWEYFRIEQLYSGQDDEKKKRSSEDNARMLSNFLKEKRHGIKVVAQVAQLQTTVGQLASAIKEYRMWHSPHIECNGCPLCASADAALATCPAPPDQTCDSCEIHPKGHAYDCPNAQD